MDRVPRAAVFGLAAIVLLSTGVAPTGGHFNFGLLFALTVLALVLALAGCLLPARLLTFPQDLTAKLIPNSLILVAIPAFLLGVLRRDAAILTVGLLAGLAWLALRVWRLERPAAAQALLCTAAVLLAAEAVPLTGVLYTPTGPDRPVVLVILAAIGFLLVLSSVLDLRPHFRTGTLFRTRLVLLFVCGCSLRIAAVVATPDPVIDVYTALTEAPRHLGQGENPYTARYSDPYRSERARALRMSEPPNNPDYPFYPPLPFFIVLPLAVGDVDVRFANVLCDMIAAAVLFLAARRPALGFAAAALYLNLPRTPFMMEQAWYEPMLAALIGGGLLLGERGYGWAGGILVGMGLTAKQYGLPLLPTVTSGQRWRFLPLAMGLLLGLVVMAPFMVWDLAAFVHVVYTSQAARPTMVDSSTVAAAFQVLWGITLPRPLLLGLLLLILGALAWTAPRGLPSALWTGASLLAFSLLHTQGYFNYFYFAQYLMILGVVALLDADSSEG